MKAYLFLLVFLSSCALFPSKFDPVLYNHLVELSIQTDQDQLICGTSNEKGAIFALNVQTKILTKYVQYTDIDIKSTISLVDKDITEMNNTYIDKTPSIDYCKLKLKVISGELDEILTGYGGKAR